MKNKFRLSSKLLSKIKWLWRLSRTAGSSRLSEEHLVFLQHVLDRYSIEDIEAAHALLRDVGRPAIDLALAEPAILKERTYELDLRDILGGIVTGTPHEVTARSQKAIAAMSDLAASAKRVESEPFWIAYISGARRLEETVLNQWRTGEMTEDAAKAVSWLLEALPKLTKLVRAVYQGHEMRLGQEKRETYWRETAALGRWKSNDEKRQ